MPYIGYYSTDTMGKYRHKGYTIQKYDCCLPDKDEGDVVICCGIPTLKECEARCEKYMEKHPVKIPEFNWGLGVWNRKEYKEWRKRWSIYSPDFSTKEKYKCIVCKKEEPTYLANTYLGIGCICDACMSDKSKNDLIKKILKIKERKDLLDTDFSK